MSLIKLFLSPKLGPVALSAIGLIGCLPSQKTSNEVTFSYCSEGSPSAFNPQITTDGSSHNATAYTIYNRLVEFQKGTTNIIPALAESWDISKDRKVYTFNLRKGVKFHTTDYFTPTRDFNADDVLFSVNRQRLKDHPYHKVGGGSYEYFEGMEVGKLVQKIEKLDAHKIRLTLSKPEAPFLANLAMSFMSILSKEYADNLQKSGKAEQIDHMPIGTGPFVFRRYVKDTLIRYQKNPHYWNTPVKLDNLVFAITTDANVRYQKLKAGECHFVIDPSPADLDAIRADSNLSVIDGPGLNIGYLAMNTQKKPFDNPLVRKAINHALNKKSYIDAVYLGNAIPAVNPSPPTLWSYDKSIKGYDYNPAKAKELLTQAGLKDGFETELWTLPVTRPYNPNGKKMGEMMQADLAKVDIRAKLVTYDWPTYLNKSRAGEHQLIQLGWTGDNGDPDNFLAVLLGCASIEAGSNVARWCDTEFNKVVSEAKQISSPEERVQLYQKAQKIFQEKVPWVPIAHSVTFRAMSKKVEGYIIDPLGGDAFELVELKK